MAQECRIRCRAERGTFADELVVTIPIVDSTGADAQATCLAYGNSVKVEGDMSDSGECDAVLRAHCLRDKVDVVAVVLPQSTFKNGPNVIVRKSNLIKSE